jgi:hypothetical protein
MKKARLGGPFFRSSLGKSRVHDAAGETYGKLNETIMKEILHVPSKNAVGLAPRRSVRLFVFSTHSFGLS